MKVGIFFSLGGEIISDSVHVEDGEAVGDAIQYGNHYEFWKALKPRTSTEHSFKVWPYYAFPRGKVVCIPGERVCRIYADPCLKRRDIASVIKHFGNRDFAIEVKNDKQYQCAKCNKYFALVA
ncbi:MAG: hypothetical protein ACLQF0_13090 [Dissulfurispiraceae bacterium]